MLIKDYFLPAYLETTLHQAGLLQTRRQAFAPGSSLEVERLVLSPATLKLIAKALRRRQAELLTRLDEPDRIEGLRHLAESLGHPSSEFRKEAMGVLAQISSYSLPMLSLIFDSFSRMIGKERLGDTTAWLEPRAFAEDFTPNAAGYARFYSRLPIHFLPTGSWQNRRPPELVVSIAAGNVPGIAIMQAFFPLLIGSACLGKNPSAEPYFGPRFLAELSGLEMRHNLFPLTDLACLVTFSSAEKSLLSELVHQGDHLVVTGGHAAKQQLRALSTRLRLRSRRDFLRRTSGHWHKVSFDLVARPFLAPEYLEMTAFNVAFDNSMYNTQGCLSCQQVFVEGSQAEVLTFAEAYQQAMRVILKALPKGSDPEAGLRQMYNYYEKMSGVKILTSLSEMEAHPFFVAYEDSPQTFPVYNTLNRSILIRRVANLEKDLPRLLQGVPPDLLQSCAAAIPNDRLLPVAEILGRAGINRIVAPGEIWDMQPGLESWDGYLPPYDLLRLQPGYWTTIRFTDCSSALNAAYQHAHELLHRALDLHSSPLQEGFNRLFLLLGIGPADPKRQFVVRRKPNTERLERMETISFEEKERLVHDQQEQFASAFARIVIAVSVVLIISDVLIWLIFPEYVQFLVDAALVFMAGLGALAYERVYKGRSNWKVGARLIFIFLIPAVGFFGIIMPEIVLAITTAFMMLIMLAYQIFGKEARWLGAASLVLFIANLLIAFVWKPQWFPKLSAEIQVVAAFFFGIFLLLICHIVLDRILLKQEDLLRQVQGTRYEIENRVRDEQARRRQLQDTVARYVDCMSAVSRGDLSVRIPVTENGNGEGDPLIILGRQLNDTTASLQSMIVQVRKATSELSTASAEILAVTTQQASGASEQSAAIAQATTTVDEVKTIAEQSALRTQEMTSTAQHTIDVSISGRHAVVDAIKSMTQIKGQVEGIAANILALSEQSQQIREIIETVNDIASQSNMLALNASVEAARAGEHGKGFAVVAVEVRNLAEQSRSATNRVKVILSEIQKATNATVMATEEGIKGVDRGVERIGLTRTAIEQLSEVILETAQAATQMAAGSRQQATGVEQVAMAMRSINQATLQGLASTRQAENAAQDLNALAMQLDSAVTRYKL